MWADIAGQRLGAGGEDEIRDPGMAKRSSLVAGWASLIETSMKDGTLYITGGAALLDIPGGSATVLGQSRLGKDWGTRA